MSSPACLTRYELRPSSPTREGEEPLTSSSPKELTFCYAHGANRYMVKSINYTHLERNRRGLVEYWENVMLLPPPPKSGAYENGG